MSVLARQIESPFAVVDWQPDAMAVLDEHHMSAWSADPHSRAQFAASLQQFLGSQPDTEVCTFYGRYVTDLDSFCHQLERAIPGPKMERRIDGMHGITAALRSRQSFRGRAVARSRFFVWNDADVLIRADADLFGRLADAMMGVAAEAEYASDDLLLLQRVVFVGGRALEEYADDRGAQLRSWLPDAGGEPFWRAVTGLEAPPVTRYHIDTILGG